MDGCSSKKEHMSDKMAKLRQLSEEKTELRRLEETERRNEKQRKEAMSLMTLYLKTRKRYFDMDITDGTIHIQVLKSIEEFYEEGKEMCHCVFSNGYYNIQKKPNCLILSAKINGKRTETIEVDLSSYSVIQCRGKHNMNSQYHNQIMDLINSNLWQIKLLHEHQAKAV